MGYLTDRDPGDEHEPSAVTAETEETEEAVEFTIHGLIVAETCVACGRVYRYLPLGEGSHAEWAAYFAGLASLPAHCPACADAMTREDA
jgi:hypothetical protein